MTRKRHAIRQAVGHQAAEARGRSLGQRVKDLRARGLVKWGQPFPWAYCTSDAWRDRRAVGFVLATSAADAKRAARARTDYYRARGCDGHPGVHVWPDPELATAPVGCRFQLGGERVRFEDEAAKAAGRTT